LSLREGVLRKPMNNANASLPVDICCLLARDLMVKVESYLPLKDRSLKLEASDEMAEI
jgi:hypothetical protein